MQKKAEIPNFDESISIITAGSRQLKKYETRIHKHEMAIEKKKEQLTTAWDKESETKIDKLKKKARARTTSKILAARNDPNKFIEYCFKDKDGSYFKQQWFHEEIQTELLDGDDTIIMLSRDSGKCKVAGSLINLSNGSYVKVEDFKKGEVLSLDMKTLKIISAHAKCWPNGQKRCVEIKTRTGRISRASHDHPYLRGLNWVYAEDLKPGDRIAIMRGCQVETTGEFNELDAYAIGTLVADGGLTQSVGFTCADEKIISIMHKWASQHGWNIKNNRKYQYRISGRKGAKSSGPTHYMRNIGLLGHGSHDKFVPEAILKANSKARAAFIAGYFDGDGSVSNIQDDCIELYSVNKNILVTVQDMLARFGITSVLQLKNGRYKGDVHKSWRLKVSGDDLVIFAEKIKLRGLKGDTLRNLKRLNTKTTGAGNQIDLFPDDIWRPHIKSTGLSLRKKGCRIDDKYLKSRSKLTKIAETDDNDEIRKVVNSDLMWDEVVSVEDIGLQDTYDLEVEETHNFIVNGFITHNTSQIEAHAIWRLGNDPNLRIKIVCESDNRAVERLFTIMQHIRTNDRVQSVFPWLKPADLGSWTKHKLVVERSAIMRDASIEALGVLATATGGRADLLIADDAVGRRNAIEQPKQRETVKSAWKSDWLNLLEPEGQMVWICTPWHTADNTHEMLKNPAYKVIKHAVGNETDQFAPIWKEKWPREELIRRYQKIGQLEYDRGYRLIALSGDIVVVRPEWIQYWTEPPDVGALQIFIAYDTSSGEGKDYTASVILGYDPKKKIMYVLDAWHGKLTFLKQAQAVDVQSKQWLPTMQGIERDPMGALLQYIGSQSISNIIPMRPHLSKALRLGSVTPHLEMGRILFNPKLNPINIQNPEEQGDLVTELKEFPLGANDDMVDAFVHAVTLATTYGGKSDDDGVNCDVGMVGEEQKGTLEDLFDVN